MREFRLMIATMRWMESPGNTNWKGKVQYTWPPHWGNIFCYKVR